MPSLHPRPKSVDPAGVRIVLQGGRRSSPAECRRTHRHLEIRERKVPRNAGCQAGDTAPHAPVRDRGHEGEVWQIFEAHPSERRVECRILNPNATEDE